MKNDSTAIQSGRSMMDFFITQEAMSTTSKDLNNQIFKIFYYESSSKQDYRK